MKICSKCRSSKTEDEFSGSDYTCKRCRRIAARKRYADGGDAARLENNRRHRKMYHSRPDDFRGKQLKRKYGITLDEARELFSGTCEICEKDLSLTKTDDVETAHVDHDHKINKVRGFLCDKCNRGLGYFQDNSGLTNKATEYLRRNQDEMGT